MRAAVLHEVGTVPVFADFKEPQPDGGHDVLEVLLAGLGPIDLHLAAGRSGSLTLPRVVGREGIARRPGGERVYFGDVPDPFGSIAQLAPIDLESTFPVPEELDSGLAVALGIAGLAAWLPLTWHAKLQRGESVLVLGASGVVGQIAVQAARALGAARVVAAARDRPTLERLRERGADEVVVLGGDDAAALREAAGDGYDVVVDPLYGPALQAALPATAPGARVVTIGAGAAAEATIPIASLFGRTLVGHGNQLVPLGDRREAYGRLAAHAAAGEIAVEIERLPLQRVEEAWARQARGPHAKIVVIP